MWALQLRLLYNFTFLTIMNHRVVSSQLPNISQYVFYVFRLSACDSQTFSLQSLPFCFTLLMSYFIAPIPEISTINLPINTGQLEVMHTLTIGKLNVLPAMLL